MTCNNLEGLERLWQDYRSGRLNEIAEKYFVTDEIKRRFNVESVNLATTIQEEDYLACKEFLSSKPSKSKIIFARDKYSVLPRFRPAPVYGQKTESVIFVAICNFSSTEVHRRKYEHFGYKLMVLRSFLDKKRPSKDKSIKSNSSFPRKYINDLQKCFHRI